MLQRLLQGKLRRRTISFTGGQRISWVFAMLLLVGLGAQAQSSGGLKARSDGIDQSSLETTEIEQLCEESIVQPLSKPLKTVTLPQKMATALNDFETWEDKALKGYDIAVHQDAPSLGACATACEEHPGHVTCQSFMYSATRQVCRLRHANEFAGGSSPGWTSGISLPRRSYLMIADRSVAGNAVATHQASTLARCADICACGDYRSFVYREDGTCEMKDGTALEIEASPGSVSGLKKSSELRGRKVRALYVVPKGERPKPRAGEAIAAILKEIQKHYLIQLGATFELAGDDLVTRVNSPHTAAEAVNWGVNKDLVISQLPDAYLAREEIIVSILEGTSGASGGSSGIVKMTGGFWDDSYRRFQEDELENSPALFVWSHELGHAFGLRHLRETPSECSAAYGFETGAKPAGVKVSCIMRKLDQLDTLYDYPFIPEEKRVLLDSDYGDPNRHDVLRGIVNGRQRPHASVYLKKERVLIRTSSGPDEKCLALPSEIRDGTDTSLGPCGMDGWAWTVLPDGHIRSTRDPDKCLDAEGPSYAPGTTIQVWSCKAAQPNQLWKIDKNAGTIKPQGAPEVCVQGYSTGADRARVRLAKCDGSAPQRWSFQKPIVLRSGLGSKEKCLDASSGNTAQLFQCQNDFAQQWILASDGRLHNAVSYDQCLTPEGDSYLQRTGIRISNCSSERSSQLWIVDRYSGGIRPRDAQGMCVDVSGGVYQDKRRIQLWRCNHSPAQRWFVY